MTIRMNEAIPIIQGRAADLDFIAKDDAGARIDLSEFENLTFIVKVNGADADAQSLIQKTASNGEGADNWSGDIVVSDEDQGEGTVVLRPEDTAGVPIGKGHPAELVGTNGDGDLQTIWIGALDCSASVLKG